MPINEYKVTGYINVNIPIDWVLAAESEEHAEYLAINFTLNKFTGSVDLSLDVNEEIISVELLRNLRE